MTAAPVTIDLVAVAARIHQVTLAQRSAIESNDWAEFERNAEERDLLQDALARADAPDDGHAAKALLADALVIDHGTAELVQRLLAETSATTSQVRHAHSALRGYGRPVTEIPDSGILDTSR